MRSAGLIALCLTCACGGTSSVVVSVASPSAPPHALTKTVSTQMSCPPPSTPRPLECPAIAATTVSPIDPDISAAAFALRDLLFEHERETANAAHTFASGEGNHSDEPGDADLARTLASIDARAQCGDPELGKPEKIADAAGDPPLVFFSGSSPTEAGGLGDLATWGLLAVRAGCDWKRVDIELTGSQLRRFRDPSGRRVLMQARVVDQCAEEVRAFVVNGAKPDLLLTMHQSRHEMVDSGVCQGSRNVESIETAGVLQGFRTTDCDADDTCTVVEEARFRGSSLIVTPAR